MPAAKTGTKRKGPSKKVLRKGVGFGFFPEESPSRFELLARKGSDDVYLLERDEDAPLGDEIRTDSDPRVRGVLPSSVWKVLAGSVQAVLNQSLADSSVAPGKWNCQTPMNHVLGRELCLLFWGIDDTRQPEFIQTVLSNWQSLAREERWWLYAMASSQGKQAVSDHMTPWRQSLRLIFRHPFKSARTADTLEGLRKALREDPDLVRLREEERSLSCHDAEIAD